MNVTCKEKCLVVVPSPRDEDPPFELINNNGDVVYLGLDGASDFNTLVVFTWDKSESFIDAQVSLVYAYQRPTSKF